MNKLLITKTIGTNGSADSTPLVSIVEHQFAKPTNVMVQAFLVSVSFNPQTNNFWKTQLTIHSWETEETGVKVVHTVPEFTIANPQTIKKCNWVKVRLTAVNGSGFGIINIYG